MLANGSHFYSYRGCVGFSREFFIKKYIFILIKGKNPNAPQDFSYSQGFQKKIPMHEHGIG
jgi:hypothetical protein